MTTLELKHISLVAQNEGEETDEPLEEEKGDDEGGEASPKEDDESENLSY